MNILFHLQTSNPDREANARRTIKTAEKLAAFGHNVYVVSNLPDYVDGKKRNHWLFSFKKHFDLNGVHHQQYFCVPFCFGGTIRRLFHYYSFAFSSRFARVQKNIKIDVVVATEPPLMFCKAAVYLAKKFKAKLVFDIQDIWPQVGIEIGAISSGGFKANSMQRIADYLYKKSDLVITVSNYKVAHLNELMEKFNKRAILIPNATDKSFIEQKQDEEFLNKYSFQKYFSVVHVGKVGKAQDLDSFLDIAKKHLHDDRIRFFLLGDGVMLKHILKRIEDEKISNVINCGTCNQAQCYTALVNAKMAYVSLINENLKDSVPTKLFEALYCGCPCLLSTCGESTEVLYESQLGLSSHPKNREQLYANFDIMYEEYDNIIKNKEFCFNFISNNYERDAVTRKLEKVLIELIKN